MKSTQILSLALITIGIALCAAIGARLSADVFESQRVTAQLKVVHGYLEAAQAELTEAQATLAQAQAKSSISTQAQAHGSSEVEIDPLVELTELIPTLTALSALPEVKPEASSTERLETRIVWLKRVAEQLNAIKAQPQAPRARLSSWWSVNSIGFLIGLVLIIAGALSARRQSAQQLSEPTQGERALDLGDALCELTQALSELEARSQRLSADDASARDALRDELSDTLRARLEPIIDARDRARAKLGLARYADIFGLVAQGERRLNRAWAALVDGHLPEARRSLEGGSSSIREARDALGAALKSEHSHV